MMYSSFAIALLWSTLRAQTDVVQTSPPVYRSGVELVEVAARVVDRDRKPVVDLDSHDFEVRDNGVPQSIAVFHRVRIPIERATDANVMSPSVTADVATNDFAAEARTFVIIVDDIHIDSRRTPALKSVLQRLIERYIDSHDLTAVVSTSGTPAQEFTTDRARLLQAIGGVAGRKQGADAFLDPVHDARALASTIEGVAKHLGDRGTHRVTMLLLSEGLDFNVYDVTDPKSTDVVRAIEQAIQALRRADVTLYAVDPRGLAVADEDVFAKRDKFVNPPPGSSRKGVTSALTAPDENETLRNSLQFLSHISSSSGGFAVINSNDYDQPFARIVEEASSYYVLGYYPTPPGKEGEVRNIDVKVRRADAQVYARRSYMRRRVSAHPSSHESDSKLRPSIATELERALPRPDLPVRVQTIPLRDAAGRMRVQVVVEVAGHDIQLRAVGDLFEETLDFGVLTIDERGHRENGKSATINLALTDAQARVFKQTGIRWLTDLDVSRGHYNVRIAVHGFETGRTGSVFAECDVPDFNGQPILGPIAMTSLPSLLTLTVGSLSLLPQLGGPPTASRTFVVGDVIHLTAQVYSGKSPQTEPRDIELMIIEDNAKRQGVVQRRRIEATVSAHGQYVSVPIDTAGVGVGQFVVQLRLLKNSGVSDVAASPATRFEIVAGH